MNISRDNYEAFFLDYLEGNLPEDQIDQFIDFLEQNPDLRQELKTFENIKLPKEEISFPDKGNLYKPSNSYTSDFDRKAIAFIENELSEEAKARFLREVEDNPQRMHDLEIYKLTRQVPDMRIVFDRKGTLHRSSQRVLFIRRASIAAAVLALMVAIASIVDFSRKPAIVVPEKVETAASAPEPENAPVEITHPANQVVSEEKEEPTKILASSPVRTALPAPSKTDTRQPAEKEIIIDPVPEARTKITALTPRQAEFSGEDIGKLELAAIPTRKETIDQSRQPITVDQYFIAKVKEAGNQRLNAAARLLRTGLNLASELSGDRIDYQEENGKVKSIEFESKLLAFTIPVRKK